jgi:hypothetical protein
LSASGIRCIDCSEIAQIVVKQDTVRRLVEILELIVVDRPDETPDGNAEQRESQWNQDEEDTHLEIFTSDKRSALPTTRRELSDIPMAAAYGATHPMLAKGNTVKL